MACGRVDGGAASVVNTETTPQTIRTDATSSPRKNRPLPVKLSCAYTEYRHAGAMP